MYLDKVKYNKFVFFTCFFVVVLIWDLNVWFFSFFHSTRWTWTLSVKFKKSPNRSSKKYKWKTWTNITPHYCCECINKFFKLTDSKRFYLVCNIAFYKIPAKNHSFSHSYWDIILLACKSDVIIILYDVVRFKYNTITTITMWKVGFLVAFFMFFLSSFLFLSHS